MPWSPAGAQQYFPDDIPAGHYSGICHLGGGRFAVVDDKAATDGFRLLHLDIDTSRCRILQAADLGYCSSGQPNRDMEGICYRPSSQTLFISGEKDNEVYEYRLDGQRTGRRLAMPAVFRKARANLGIEALAYDSVARQFYVTTERPLRGDSLLRIQAFADNLKPSGQLLYRPDPPISRKYHHGVAALCAPGDGRLLVLERQIKVPRLKLDALSVVRIYEVRPAAATSRQPLQKRLLREVRTRLTLTSRRFANYEGMCAVAPGVLLLIADSQHQYKGVLRDWLLMLKENQE